MPQPRATLRSIQCTLPRCKPGGQTLSNSDGVELTVTVEFSGSKKRDLIRDIHHHENEGKSYNA